MPRYNVHLRPEIVVKLVDIEAESQLEALEKAEAMLQGNDNNIVDSIRYALDHIGHLDGVQFIELTEDLKEALVDRQGDDFFRESTWWTCDCRSEWEPKFKEEPDGPKDV